MLPDPAPTPAPGSARAVELATPGPQGTRIRSLLGPDIHTVFPPTSITPTDQLLLETWSAPSEGSVWTHAVPTRFDHKNYRESPPGTALMDSRGRSFTYARSLAQTGECPSTDPCWEVEAGTIHYRGEAPKGFFLRHEPTLRDSTRRSFAHAGLSPWAFVDWTAAIDGLTREALLVPIQGQITVSVHLNGDSRLRFGFGAPAPRLHSDLARPNGQIRVGETVIWNGSTKTDQPWTEHTVDLSPWTGQTIALTFEASSTDPVHPTHVVAFAEPTILSEPGADARPRRVVVVGIDTLRLDHLGLHGAPDDRTPGLDARGRTGVLFDNAWAPAPRTRPSFRSALTGRWPLDAIGAPPLTRRFADAGFATAGVVANVHLQPHLGFADGAGWWDYHDSDDAGPQVDRAIDWLDTHANEDSFLFLHLMDPHIFYLAPEPFKDAYTEGLPRQGMPDKYNRWTILDAMADGTLTPAHKRFIQARYQGEIRYLDYELARLLAHLDTLPGDTLVVLHSDHGEEFWDHGEYEHNHSLHPELMRVMLWFIPPKGWSDGPIRVPAPVSLVDIVPTLLELLGIPQHADETLDGTSLASWLDPQMSTARAELAATLSDRPLQMGHMMFNREQWGVIHAGWAYTLETMTGMEQAYKVTETKPNTIENPTQPPIDTLRAALARATGWPVSDGWRIQIDHPEHPFSLSFDTPIDDAGVLDPEAGRSRRANLEWGEVPPVRPEEVATVTISDDGLTVHVEPGTHAKGTLYVLGPTTESRAEVTSEQVRPYTVRPGTRMLGRTKAEITAGTLVIPSAGEGARLAELGDPRLAEALRAMGYIE